MHPSSPSSSDPNAPYRAAIASLVDCNFLHDEQQEQPDVANSAYQFNPFAELSPRRASSSNPSSTIANTGSSSASHATISTVLDYLAERGRGGQLVYGTINSRLNSTNLSAETLLSALKVTDDANHPFLAAMGVNDFERSELFKRLDGIVNNSSGFKKGIKEAVKNSNNDPQKLLENILYYVRNLKY